MEPKYVADMPHLPPPPEMLELQKNSFFPVDVPKIGVSNEPYRPPELIFDEYHRKTDFPKKQFKRKIDNEQYQPGKFLDHLKNQNYVFLKEDDFY